MNLQGSCNKFVSLTLSKPIMKTFHSYSLTTQYKRCSFPKSQLLIPSADEGISLEPVPNSLYAITARTPELDSVRQLPGYTKEVSYC